MGDLSNCQLEMYVYLVGKLSGVVIYEVPVADGIIAKDGRLSDVQLTEFLVSENK